MKPELGFMLWITSCKIMPLFITSDCVVYNLEILYVENIYLDFS